MAFAGVVEQADVGQDDRVDPQIGSAVHGSVPVGFAPRLRKGVDRHQHMLAARVSVADALDHCLLIEVEAGEIACVGVVFVAEINRIGTVINRRLERRQAASRANEFG